METSGESSLLDLDMSDNQKRRLFRHEPLTCLNCHRVRMKNVKKASGSATCAAQGNHNALCCVIVIKDDLIIFVFLWTISISPCIFQHDILTVDLQFSSRILIDLS